MGSIGDRIVKINYYIHLLMGKEMLCTVCGYSGPAKKILKGSFWIEIILWLTFIVPGLIYSIWRLGNQVHECPKCKSQSMIPVDSPKAQEMLRNQK